jgi:Tol biopolymer transport system component
MNARHRGTRRSAVVISGLATYAVAAVAALAPTATAGTAAAASTGHNEQVALVNETDAQPVDTKSHLNGTAQVASYDGTSVVFSTTAALVPQDTNDTDDVYLRNDGITILVSARGETIGNDSSFEPTISDDGRFVAFTTAATNLTGKKDTNKHTLDVVVRDMYSTKIALVSQSSAGFQRGQNSFFPVISGNGRAVSFQTFGSFGRLDDDNKEDVYVRHLGKGTTKQASQLPGPGGDVRGPVLNGDISDDGTKVVWGNSEMLWMRDLSSRETIRFWHEPAGGAPCSPFPAGTAGRPVISGNGHYAAFSSCGTDLPGDNETGGVYRIDLTTGKIRTVAVGTDGNSYLPSLSRSGRFVGFGSEASDIVAGDTEGQPDAFVADLRARTITRASQNTEGVGGNSWSASTSAAISGDGHTLVYTSYADNLVAGDLYDYEEAFAWHS